MAADAKIPFLGAIPLDPQLLAACEEGVSYCSTRPQAPARKPFLNVIEGTYSFSLFLGSGSL
jgi:hypothetical protein